MIKRLFILIVSLASAVGLSAQESASLHQGYTVAAVPNVQLLDARRFTTDPDGVLSAATVAEIDRMCGELRQRQLAEVAVVVLERVDPTSLDMFAHNILNRWGVGQKGKDNGLVISVIRQQRDIQFAPGYGLEGVLPDALCKRIQAVYMIEPLRAGDFDKGVLDGVRAAYNVLTDNQAELTALKAADGGGAGIGLIGLLAPLFLIFMAILILIAARHNKRGGGRGGNRYDDDGMPGGSGPGRIGGPDAGSIIGGILGGLLGGGLGGGFGGGFGGGGVGGFGGGGFGGGRSGGGGARSGF